MFQDIVNPFFFKKKEKDLKYFFRDSKEINQCFVLN